MFFSSLTLIFWRLENIILKCSEKEHCVPSRVAGSEATLKPEISQSPSCSHPWQILLILLCKTPRGFEVKQQAGDTDAGPSQVFLLCWSSSYTIKALLKITDHFQDFGRREESGTVVKLSLNLQKKRVPFCAQPLFRVRKGCMFTVLWIFEGSTRCYCLKKSSILPNLGRSWMHIEWRKYFDMKKKKIGSLYFSVF